LLGGSALETISEVEEGAVEGAVDSVDVVVITCSEVLMTNVVLVAVDDDADVAGEIVVDSVVDSVKSDWSEVVVELSVDEVCPS
jgi:hypothetical protein